MGRGDLWMCVCERESKRCVTSLGVGGGVRLMWGCLGVVGYRLGGASGKGRHRDVCV